MPTDYALQFDGVKSWLNLGTLGNLGSQLGSGFFWEFDIMQPPTTSFNGGWGFGQYASAGSSRFWMVFNNTLNVYTITFNLGDTSSTGKLLTGSASTFKKLNDGKRHSISVQAYPATNTITITIDGQVLTTTYSKQQTPATFGNFLGGIAIGVVRLNQYDTYEKWWKGTVDNLKIGTDKDTIYAGWGFNEGTGTTAADYTGNGRTATLTFAPGGTVRPTWVTGLKRIYFNIGSEVWKVGRDMHVHLGGDVWKRVKNVYLQVSGVWKLIY